MRRGSKNVTTCRCTKATKVTHEGVAYAVVDGPHYVANWESASISVTFVVKAAPSNRR
jgi:hypothetical protein